MLYLYLTLMPLVSDKTEYTWHEEGVLRSLTSSAIFDMMRGETTAQQRDKYSRLIRFLYPKSPFWIRTPGADVVLGWLWFAQWKKRALAARDILYPMGLGIRHIDLSERAYTEVRHPIRLGPEQLLEQPFRDYSTVAGKTKPLHQGVIVENYPWLPKRAQPDLVEADEYTKECRKLQATKAGRKAKELLLSHLNTQQANEYMRKGYFIVSPPKEEHTKHPRLYVIERGHVCANIVTIEPARSKKGHIEFYPRDVLCFHSEDPYPLDDVLLAQKYAIETDEKGFLKECNFYVPTLPNKPFEKSLRAI